MHPSSQATSTLNGRQMSLRSAYAIAHGHKISLDEDCFDRIQASRNYVESIAKGTKPVYGVNTGFGYFANKCISHDELMDLQRNILRSHAAGHGKPLGIPETRLAMCLRLNVFMKGFTGVRLELCQALQRLINAEIYPVIPEKGSVGASGDLAPLAHLALALIGEGDVRYQGTQMPAKKALDLAQLQAYKLQEKEGLSLINGTQIMLAIGSLALHEGIALLEMANLACALSFEALEARTDALSPSLHAARGHEGQIHCAQQIRETLQGSYLNSPAFQAPRVQDPYSLRCSPQVHGPCYEHLMEAKRRVEKEMNGATDNPLVFPEEEKIISGGNFHGEVLAMSYDAAALAVAELANISERRIELLLNPHFSRLNAFLTPYEGTHSGYMASQYLAASLVTENKVLSHPACTDSIPGNVGVEDHVSMGLTSAHKLRQIVTNCKILLAIEITCAAQAIDLRKSSPLAEKTQSLYTSLREHIPFLDHDRIVSEDTEKSVNMLGQMLHNMMEK